MTWTDDRVSMLKKLFDDGLSASQIAVELGSVTRNGVIGKIHRLGLSGKSYAHTSVNRALPAADGTMPVPVPRVRKPRTQGTNVRHKIATRVELVAALPSAPREQQAPEVRSIFACQVLELNKTTCRWPSGDPQDRANFHFCGAKPLGDLPYCPPHARTAYHTPDQARAARRQQTGSDSK